MLREKAEGGQDGGESHGEEGDDVEGCIGFIDDVAKGEPGIEQDGESGVRI